MIGKTDLKIYSGAEKPLKYDLVTAAHVHGKSGLDIEGSPIKIAENYELQDQHAVDFIIQTCHDFKDQIYLCPTGPLTNIAMSLQKDPSIIKKIKEIVFMGGAAMTLGNITPAAEFNIYVDPEAAKLVLQCSRPIVMMSLDVTHQVLTTQKRVDTIRNLVSSVGEEIAALIEFYERYDEEKYHLDGAPLHDPCTVAYLLKPELFKFKNVNVEIETGGIFTLLSCGQGLTTKSLQDR